MKNAEHQIIEALAAYLEALPKQVQAWDFAVIDHFIANPKLFYQFSSGSDPEKWYIYASIRYGQAVSSSRMPG